jgi:hypothetical protein
MLSQSVIVFASCWSITVPNNGDSSAASLVLVIYPLVGLHRKHCLQQSFYSCVFLLCVAMAHLIDDVTVCILCQCLATDDFSC